MDAANLPGGLAAPAWVVALATAFFLGAKAVLQIREGMDGDSNPEAVKDDGRWQGKMMSLVERSLDLQESTLNEHRQLRETLVEQGELIRGQTHTLKELNEVVLDHRQAAERHREMVKDLHEEVVNGRGE